MTHTMTPSMSRTLRAEGAAIFLAALWAFQMSGASWWLFAALILAPDLAMLGYLAGPRIGAICYNLIHSYTPVLAIGAILYALGSPPALPLTAILVAHIGVDRAMGYGLKYTSGFKDTHLGVFS
ncbi:DUF4260 domain-containing protein [Sulfitobacter sp. 20_GPM-1509m]|uniref:DUF4260 domain-containing protein n=1 Tax=Sulfitobacter sp. 20_GPM-1509m TaxID=1380367 RepID=UPI000A5F656A|nr:DUF4260 domain-containing protein [Sulfitobacter sp. 20_GPM-1509m]